MGIDADLLSVLGKSVRTHGIVGRLATLGVQDFGLDERQTDLILTAAGFTGLTGGDAYSRLGFTSVESLDISAFEGCTHILDLNAAATPPELVGRYDMVFDGGTLEHVFDTRAALRHIFHLLAPGGVVMHASPTNGWVDHGFYQFSPTFFLDYYLANGFELLDVLLLQRGERGATVSTYVSGAVIAPHGGRTLTLALARKCAASTHSATPQQRYYSQVHGAEQSVANLDRRAYAPPVFLVDGLAVEPEMVEIPLTEIRPAEGLSYAVKLSNWAHLSDASGGAPSPLQLTENGRPVGPPHALHQQIRDTGGGRFSHWGEWLIFSTPDNQSPVGRQYAVRLPRSVLGLTRAFCAGSPALA